MRRLLPLLLLAGCSFDAAGVAATGDDVIDADPGAIDADPGAPDADPGAPDAEPGPPDAEPTDPDDDDDTILDVNDNCPQIPNTNQHDEDSDTVGDVCDNCPAVSNLSQANTTEGPLATGDQVGDACDPHPTTAELIVLFEPFIGAALPDGWIQDGGSWTVSSDGLHQGLTTSGSHHLYFENTTFKNPTLVTRVNLDTVVLNPTAGSDLHSVGSLTRYEPTARVGYFCVLIDDSTTTSNTLLRDSLYDDGTAVTLDVVDVGSDMMAGQVFDLTAIAIDDRTACRANTFAAAMDDLTHTDGLIGLRTNAVGASFPYVMVVQAP